MTHKNNYTLIEDLAEQGLDAIPELVRIVINNAMQVERAKHLKAESYERIPDCSGYANGYKPKTVKTKMGEITFDVPQVRSSDFYPSTLEKGMRSERALNIALAKMSVSFTAKRKCLCSKARSKKGGSGRYTCCFKCARQRDGRSVYA